MDRGHGHRAGFAGAGRCARAPATGSPGLWARDRRRGGGKSWRTAHGGSVGAGGAPGPGAAGGQRPDTRYVNRSAVATFERSEVERESPHGGLIKDHLSVNVRTPPPDAPVRRGLNSYGDPLTVRNLERSLERQECVSPRTRALRRPIGHSERWRQGRAEEAQQTVKRSGAAHEFRGTTNVTPIGLREIDTRQHLGGGE